MQIVMRAVMKWLAEPVLVVGSFLLVLGTISLINGGEFRAPVTLSGSGTAIADRAEAIPSAVALAGTPASTLAFVRRTEGPRPAEVLAAGTKHDAADSLHTAAEREPVLGILFDDAWLLLLAGSGVLLMGRGLRLLTQPVAIPRSA